MIELDRRIRGDWVDIREAGMDQYRLSNWFKIPPAQLIDLNHRLRLEGQNGILDYKRSVLSPVFVALEEMKFSSLSLETLRARIEPLKELLLVVLLQRLLCTGVIQPRQAKSPEPVSVDEVDVKSIINDVKNRLRQDPEFQKHRAVKNILMQVSNFQREREKVRELLPTIKPEKKAIFRQNVRSTFQRIFQSIRHHYADLLAEESAAHTAGEARADLFRRLPIKELASSLMNQAREVSRLLSTLTFAIVEKYRTREALVRLHRERVQFLKLIDQEGNAYQKLCAQSEGTGDCAPWLNGRFRDEVIRTLEKLAQQEEDG